MRRALLFVLLFAPGCALPQERLITLPLPEEGPPLRYVQVVGRARSQATVANEAFYINRWADLEDAAKAIGETARYLPKATEVPARHKDILAVHSTDLSKEAEKLREAARTRDVQKTNESLQQINLKVRELRSEN